MRCEELHRDNGAVFHSYEFRAGDFSFSVRPKTAMGRLRPHLLARGYEEQPADERLDGRGVVSYRTYRFTRGDDEVQIRTYAESTYEIGGRTMHQAERVNRILHFPQGTRGDGRSRLTFGDIVNAMSWGAVSAA